MAFTDYQVTPAGDGKLLVNGVKVHAGRKVLLESTAGATVTALKYAYIAAVTTATVYDDGVAPNQTYTVQAAGNLKILHNGVLKATGTTLQLDPLEPTAISMVARGIIV